VRVGVCSAGQLLGGSAAERTGLVVRQTATLTDPISQMCTLAQMEEPTFRRWTDALGWVPIAHRKQWEVVYILQVLDHYGAIRPGARGLGFGVGEEALPSLLASYGCSILATDLPADHHEAAQWRDTGQHSDDLSRLHFPALCPRAEFDARVAFRPVDMNAIPEDLQGFDFCWSACAYEHLGSIEKGLRFFKETVRRLKPGGIAVHTTEFNLSSNTRTIDDAATVLFRRRDMERLAMELRAEGHEVMPITYDQGSSPLDEHIDIPPYCEDTHLKLAIRQFVTTSFGLIARRG
jgi:SAM-dependent methyltransferase